MCSIDGKELDLAQMVVNRPMRFSQVNQALVNLTMQCDSRQRDRVFRTAAANARHIQVA